MNALPFPRGFSLADNVPDGATDTDFLEWLDSQLRSVLCDLAAGKNLTQIHHQVRQLCNKVTHGAREDHRLGVERNKLLQPGWEATWSREKQVYTALLLRLRQVLPTEQADYLYEAFRYLVALVAQGKTDHIRRRIGQELHGILGDYLSLRGHEIPQAEQTPERPTVGFLGNQSKVAGPESGKDSIERVRQIARRLRLLPEHPAYKDRLPGDLCRRASQLSDEAVKLGAFAEAEHEVLHELRDRAHHFYPDKWDDVVWHEAVTCLCPDLEEKLGPVGSIVPACGPIADLIDAEAAKLEVDWSDDGDKWSRHVFNTLVNENSRMVRREGYDEIVDLSGSAVGWHIFQVALESAPKQATLKALEDGYPGEWSARSPAVADLNTRLAPLRVKVYDRTLIEVLD